ncbi:enoyl-CoA hydratase-related protein [Thermodesulfobacteriota bacterium]
MNFDTIIYQPGKIARLIMNCPENLNAQSRLMLSEIDDAMSMACKDDDVRVIIVSGAGKHFSAGHDVKEMSGDLAPETRTQRHERVKRVYIDDHLRWRNASKPTIAMVQGYCIWGGWMVASAMDLLFASEDAIFLANPYPADFWALPWDLPPKKAKEMLFEHRAIRAREAMEMGFVNRVYPSDRLETETLAYAERVAENNQAHVRAIKYIINQTLDAMGYTASVTNALHASGMFDFARPDKMNLNPYADFADVHDNPHSNLVRKAWERFQAEEAKKQEI